MSRKTTIKNQSSIAKNSTSNRTSNIAPTNGRQAVSIRTATKRKRSGNIHSTSNIEWGKHLHPPSRAILLAAGFGSRMQPLSFDTPKPLMPLWGIPLLEHSINLLISWGVRDILINTHHAPEQIVQYCLNRKPDACRLQLSFEPEILGTGGALKKAEWFIGNKPFWMLNTDVAADLDPTPLLRAFKKNKAIAALWMHPTLGPRTVEVKNCQITNFASPTPGADGTYTFCGLQLLSPRILKHLPHKQFYSVIDSYRSAIKEGENVLGITSDKSFWADLGTRERYLNAHRDILDARNKKKPGKKLLLPSQLKRMTARIPKNVKVNGFAALGDNVTIESNVDINDSVIWNDATLSKGCKIENSIVGEDVTLRGDVDSSSTVRCSTLPQEDVVLRLALKALRIKPENAILIALPARGSNRSFERIQTKTKSAMLVRYDDKTRPENAQYASHTKLLIKHGIRVPRLLLDLPEHNATLFEDAGTIDLELIAKSLTDKQLIAIYKLVLDQLFKLHSIKSKDLKSTKLEPAFPNQRPEVGGRRPVTSPDLYTWERELFTTHFLHDYLNLSKKEIKQINNELSQLASVLTAAPQVLLHRDMQSSNVLLPKGKPVIIDFQGMRMGPAAYDIASLLCDPYVMLSEDVQSVLLEYYWNKIRNQRSSPPTLHSPHSTLFSAAAIQRLSQALGAFARLSKLPDMQRYEEYIPLACNMMLRILKTRKDMPNLVKLMESIFN